MRPMNFNLDRKHLVIVESELDGLLIDQEAGDMAGVVALGSAQTKPDQELNRLLKMASRLLITLDFDGAGASAAWRYWLSNYPGSKRWPTPYGKDPSEAAQRGLNIGLWIRAGLTSEPLTGPKHEPTEATIRPFPREWLQQFDETQLERLAIMTVDGRLSDQEALRLLS